jgi:hypothetical protein
MRLCSKVDVKSKADHYSACGHPVNKTLTELQFLAQRHLVYVTVGDADLLIDANEDCGLGRQLWRQAASRTHRSV